MEEPEEEIHNIHDSDEEEDAQAADYRFLGAMLKSKKDYALPSRGEKDFEPDGTNKQDKILTASRDAMYDALSVEREITAKNYIRATWVPDLKLARIEKHHVKGPMFKAMGKVDRENICWVLPEELLYLVERGNVECFYQDKEIAMSLQAAYAECIPHITLDYFQVYAYLKRAGFMVLRTRERKPPDPPSASRLFALLDRLAWLWRPAKGVIRRDQVYYSFRQVYRRLQYISHHTLDTRYVPNHDNTLHISFDVWKPNTHFRKSNPGIPDFQVAVLDASTNDLFTQCDVDRLFASLPLRENAKKSPFARLKEGHRNFVLAVVDLGVISFLNVGDTNFAMEDMTPPSKFSIRF